MIDLLNTPNFAPGADVRSGDVARQPRHTPTNDIPKDLPSKVRSASEDAGQKVDELLNQADRIFEAAGEDPLTLEQQLQIEDLDRQIQGIVQNDIGPEDPFAGLSAQSIQQLDQLFSDIDALLNQTAGQPLNFAQNRLLNALDQKVANIFTSAHVEI